MQLDGEIMLHFAICDSDRAFSNKIIEVLNSLSWNTDVRIISHSYTAIEDLHNIFSIEFNAMIVCPELPGEDGIAIAREYKKHYPRSVILFYSSDTQRIIEGYSAFAYRYYLKNSDIELLDKHLLDLIDKVKCSYEILPYSLTNPPYLLKAYDIVYIEGQLNVSVFVDSNDNEYVMSKRMFEVENDLTHYGFLRIHKSYIVNIMYIKKLLKRSAVLTTGKILPVPQARIESIKQKLQAYFSQ